MSDIINKIFNKVNSIISDTTKEYREKLDANIHVLDISYSALTHSLPKLTLAEYDVIIVALKKEYKLVTSLKHAMSVIKDPTTILGYSPLVQDPEYGDYILGKNYNVLQSKLAKVLKSIESTSVFTGTDALGKTTTNIGHIPGNILPGQRSPLSDKIIHALKSIPINASKPVISQLNNLYNEHSFETSYNFQRANFDVAGFSKILGKMSVVVTLQTFERNNEFATKIEGNINNKLRSYCSSDEFKDLLLNTPGSNTIKEDLVGRVLAILRGEKVVPGPKHTRKPAVINNSKVIGKGRPVGFIPKVKLRSIDTGRFVASTSTNLLVLLNHHLHDVVAANMGDGSQRRILNYRTGRFATSTLVERLTVSREGTITAFYSYMKNPYATFSGPSGAQMLPKTRDPKLLISKSIREIAAKYAATNLRAVNI